MELLIALVASVAFALTMRDPLKAHPAVFYVAAVLVSAAFASHAALEIAPVFGRALFPYVQRCLFAFGLLSVVMFVGVLPEGSRLRRYLNPVRGKLSVVASILVAGHVANYAQSYLRRWPAGFQACPPRCWPRSRHRLRSARSSRSCSWAMGWLDLWNCWSTVRTLSIFGSDSRPWALYFP